MEYDLDRGEADIIVTVRGRVDEASWADFDAGLKEAVDQAKDAGLAAVIIDLAQLDYMSSRGLRVLTVAKREADAAGITITLQAPNDVMREILSISRYDKLFVITEAG